MNEENAKKIYRVALGVAVLGLGVSLFETWRASSERSARAQLIEVVRVEGREIDAEIASIRNEIPAAKTDADFSRLRERIDKLRLRSKALGEYRESDFRKQ